MTDAKGKRRDLDELVPVNIYDLTSGRLKEEDFEWFQCPNKKCHALVYVIHNRFKRWAFGGRHVDGCGLAAPKKKNGPTGPTIPGRKEPDLVGLLKRKRKRMAKPGRRKAMLPEGFEEYVDDVTEELEEDRIPQVKVKKCNTSKSIKEMIQEYGLGVDLWHGLTGKDVIMTPENLRDARQGKMSGWKMVETRRVHTRPDGLEVPDWWYCVRGKDWDPREKDLYFIVRLENNDDNDDFRDLLMGNKRKGIQKARGNILVMLAEFSLHQETDRFVAYKAVMKSANQYHYEDDRHAEG